jgi:hypothetical protein
MGDFVSVTEKINTENRHIPLLLSWHLFNGGQSAKSAKIHSIESNKLNLEIRYDNKSEDADIISLKIDPPFVNPSEAGRRILHLGESCMAAKFPTNNPLAYLCVLLWIMLFIVCLVSPQSSLTALVIVREYLLKVFVSVKVCSYMLAFLVIAHTIEAMVVLLKLKSLKIPSFSFAALNTWASLTMLIGFPITGRALILNKTMKVKDK